MQCFRVRAGVFASAHGRPNGVPGRIVGARAKALPWDVRNGDLQRHLNGLTEGMKSGSSHLRSNVTAENED